MTVWWTLPGQLLVALKALYEPYMISVPAYMVGVAVLRRTGVKLPDGVLKVLMGMYNLCMCTFSARSEERR